MSLVACSLSSPVLEVSEMEINKSSGIHDISCGIFHWLLPGYGFRGRVTTGYQRYIVRRYQTQTACSRSFLSGFDECVFPQTRTPKRRYSTRRSWGVPHPSLTFVSSQSHLVLKLSLPLFSWFLGERRTASSQDQMLHWCLWYYAISISNFYGCLSREMERAPFLGYLINGLLFLWTNWLVGQHFPMKRRIGLSPEWKTDIHLTSHLNFLSSVSGP